MFLSIIIPIYNAEKYLAETLDSLLPLATDNDCEIILVNDGSKDHSFQIINTYKNKFCHITCYNQSNQGVSVARNKAINLANGEYIWFVDADDIVNGKYVSELKKLDLSHTDLFWFSHLNIDKNGKELPFDKQCIQKQSIEDGIYTVVHYVNKFYKGAGMLWAY